MTKIFQMIITITTLLILTTGCATVTSEHVNTSKFNSDKNSGVLYFLPQRMMKLTATREPVKADTKEKAKKKYKDAKAALENATKAEAASKGQYNGAKQGFDKGKTRKINKDFSKEDKNKLLEKLKLKTDTLFIEHQIAIDTLIKAKRAFEISETNYKYVLFLLTEKDESDVTEIKKSKVTIKLELLPAGPDPKAAYIAKLKHSILRDDLTKIVVNDRGLLSSSKVTAEDKTSDILVDIAGVFGIITGSSFPKMDPLSTIGDLSDINLGCPIEKPLNYERVFDPSVANEVTHASNYLYACFGRKLIIDTLVKNNNDDIPDEIDGYVYRMAMPYTVNVVNYTQGTPHSEQSVVAMLPNNGPLAYIPMKSSAFVKTVDDVTFKDGSILSWDSTRPSEMAAFFRIPVAMLKAIVSVPAELIQLKFDSSKSLAEGQAAQIRAQTELQAVQACIEDAKENETSLSVCIPGFDGADDF
ncbi:MAG: hypothetical protein JKY84_09555 [Emcibacteraceae bacterium]|nr:hypothetical protein [Emcibacteraceae bacterium]